VPGTIDLFDQQRAERLASAGTKAAFLELLCKSSSSPDPRLSHRPDATAGREK
jgi:hypothetical protein